MAFNFVEIGTSDFDTCIQTATDTDVGLSVEPILFYLEHLPNKPHVIKANLAVSDHDGQGTMSFVSPQVIKDIESQTHNSWIWLKGTNSLDRKHPSVNRLKLPSQSITVEVVSFPTLCSRYHIESIDYLKIDTEGHEYPIITSYIDHCKKMGKMIAHKIQFETEPTLTPQAQINDMTMKLQQCGYHVVSTGFDTVMEL
jgi:FkbM family methyltransferase